MFFCDLLKIISIFFERKENADEHEEITEEEHKEVDNDIRLKGVRKENVDNLERYAEEKHKKLDNDIGVKQERKENVDNLEGDA